PAIAVGLTPISSSASMTAIWASPRAPPLPSASAKLFMANHSQRRLAREFESLRRKRPHQFRFARGIGAGRGAIAHPSGDALHDRGQAKKIIGEVDRQMRPRVETGPRQIGRDIVVARRYAERSKIEADQRAGA